MKEVLLIRTGEASLFAADLAVVQTRAPAPLAADRFGAGGRFSRGADSFTLDRLNARATERMSDRDHGGGRTRRPTEGRMGAGER